MIMTENKINDLVQKLRQSVGNLGTRDPSEYGAWVTCADLIEAADAIERLKEERDEALETLDLIYRGQYHP